MQHRFNYEMDNKEHTIISTMACEGLDNVQTAMAMTVGLPVGIATKLILTGEINVKGVQLPTIQSIYKPVLKELETFGISFKETNHN